MKRTIRTPSAWQRLPSRAAVAVETVRLGSAGLNASYYGMLGLVAHPAAGVGLGLVAFAADYSKGATLTAAMTKGHGFGRRLAAWLVFVVLFVASMIAVDGVLMKLRSALVAGPANTISAHDRASGEYRASVAELDKLGTVRTPEAIRADMDGAPVSRAVFRRTAECTDITKDASLAACKPLLELRKEMALAIRKRELEAARDAAKVRLDALGPRPSSADPQAEVLAGALEGYGVSPGLVAYGMVAIIGFAIELVACFGLYVLGNRRTLGKPANDRPANVPANVAANVPAPSGPVPPRGGRKASAMSANVVPFAGKRAALAALQQAGGPVSNRQLARLMGVSDGEASKRVRELGGLVNVERRGRCVMVWLAGQVAAA
ncbi:MAG: hypothetical protein B7Y80_20070 [Hyphomicrobium sp. 32-62-53]|nr:MAG: hypothetical protein B7Z29_19900 [Hyphomicrobium sp. 12-62-95]OYX97330.1 MAG: hypothetical protein B7Y80_20070 [Hyphomicrobium sp. 32-62-53]